MWIGIIGRLEDGKFLDARVVLAVDHHNLVIEVGVIGRYVGFYGLAIVDNFGAEQFSSALHIIKIRTVYCELVIESKLLFLLQLQY